MELYKSEIIENLQNAVNQGFYHINSYTDYSFLTYGNGIYSNGIRINLKVDSSTGRRDVEITIKDQSINNEFIKGWRETNKGYNGDSTLLYDFLYSSEWTANVRYNTSSCRILYE